MVDTWTSWLRTVLDEPPQDSPRNLVEVLAVLDEFIDLLGSLGWGRARVTAYDSPGKPSLRNLTLLIHPPTRWDHQVSVESFVIRDSGLETVRGRIETPAEMITHCMELAWDRGIFYPLSREFLVLEDEEMVLEHDGERVAISASERRRAVQTFESGAEQVDVGCRFLSAGLAFSKAQSRASLAGIVVDVGLLRSDDDGSGVLHLVKSPRGMRCVVGNTLVRAVDAVVGLPA